MRNMFKIMKIKIIALIFSFSFLCSAQQNLEQLIDKSDFINFKSAYAQSNLSEKEKNELLVQVDKNIDVYLKKLKPFFGGRIPTLKQGARDLGKAKNLIFGGAVLLSIMQIVAVGIAYDTHKHQKNTANRFNRTAASFQGANSRAKYGRYLARKRAAINLWNSDYWLAGTLGVWSFFSSIFMGFLYHWTKNMLIVYKQWKKALKIKKLIEESLQNKQIELTS